jgi:hypothetical protein
VNNQNLDKIVLFVCHQPSIDYMLGSGAGRKAKFAKQQNLVWGISYG